MKKIKLLKKSNGITLVALVVTIIVLIILTGISITLALKNNGITSKAKLAKEEKLNSEVKEQEFLNQLKEYAENKGNMNDIILSTLKTVNELKGGDFFEEKTKIKDDNKNIIVVPEGFKIDEESGNNIEEGIVIEDKNGNEFVWIPVNLEEGESFETKYPRTEFEDNEPTETVKSYYTEPFSSGYPTEKEDYESMIASVNENKGFYIGRYETGTNEGKERTKYTSFTTNPSQEEIDNETKKLTVSRNKYVYNYVHWGAAMNNIKAVDYNAIYDPVGNYGKLDGPTYVIGAVELAKNFSNVNNYKGVTSTLTYGIQWDMILRYVSDEQHNINNCYSWGNYIGAKGEAATDSGNLQTTGKNDAWQAKKIYDLAGNAWEWTMEAAYNYIRVIRGGSWGGGELVDTRHDYDFLFNYNNVTFRIALYL